MSDAPAKKRCPNCAWAFWYAHRHVMPSAQSWLLVAIAERVDSDLHYFATMAQLEIDTRIKPATLKKHLSALVKRGCIRMTRSRDGYHYELLRPAQVASAPPSDGTWKPSWESNATIVTEQEPQKMRVSTLDVPQPELPVSPPVLEKNAVQEHAKNAVPYIESLQESLKKERGSLRSPRARARVSMTATDQWEMAFKAFYALYPRKVGVDRARKAFFARLKASVSPDEIIDGLKRHVFTDRMKYIPHPSTWLNDGCWRDEVPVEIDPALRAALTPEEIHAMQSGAMQQPMLLALAGGRRS